MDDPRPGPDERDRPEQPAPADEGAVPEDDFYRGAAASVRPTPDRLRLWPGGFDADRPPVWLSVPLVLVAVVAGLFAFSTVWNLAGDGLLAVPIAALAGLCVGAGAVLVAGYAWTRTSNVAGSG